jgi:uncharacterized GH25 family protein
MQSKALTVFALLAVLALAAYWFVGSDDPVTLTDPNEGEEVVEPDTKPARPIAGERAAPDQPNRPNNSDDLIRTAVTDELPSGAKSPQGVEGRILNQQGGAIAGATVYLLRGTGLDSFKLLLAYQKGDRIPPAAMATSDENGRFRIGLKDWNDEKTYEVRVLHENYADHRIERINIQPKDWWNVGDVVMKQGATIRGTVFAENGVGIAEATVTARPQFTHGMLSVPGREAGLEVKTDASGHYELANIDPLDFAGLSAHATGHTRVDKTEIQLQVQNPIRIDFQLSEGFEISGIVVDPQGKPVSRAKVTCSALSQKSPQQEDTYTNRQGEFLVHGLRGGVFSVIVNADGFQEAEEKPVPAGTQDLNITVEKLGEVYVTARGRNGVALSRFLCNIKPALDGQSTYGKPMLVHEAKRAKNGTELISGLRPLTYVAEVSARGYAKNFSARFTIVEGQTEPAAVEVQLNQGGTLRGVVQDEKGEPVPGVTIKTLPYNLIENPLITAFGGMPYTITRATKKTDSKGRFVFKLLHPGEYQLKFTHPEYCAVFTKKNMAEVGVEMDLPRVTMPRGCQVSGVAELQGKATGQVKIHISAVHKKDTLSSFTTEATTDNDGLFLMPKRVPAGDYEYRAAQMSLGPFMIMIQFQKKTPFTIRPGEERRQLRVVVPVIKK